MRILLVSATYMEIAPTLAVLHLQQEHHSRFKSYSYASHNVDVLLTGVGMVATAAWLGRTLAQENYDLVINAGVCGSFTTLPAVGDVVQVISDFFPELGAEDGEDFLSIHDLQLLGENEAPFQRSRLFATGFESAVLKELPQVSGITVNTVHGNGQSIETIRMQHHPQVETMEGAAFLYACLTAGQTCVQLRAVSNRVERRNREAWNLALAIRNLNITLIRFLDTK
jgi:futalosine hydrolase